MSAAAGGGGRARRRLVTAAVLALGATAAACTGEQTSGERTATPRNSPGPTPSARPELAPPELRPGHEQIVSEGPREGSRNLGRVTLRKGVNWVDVTAWPTAAARLSRSPWARAGSSPSTARATRYG